jgi:hypothetical protein
MITATVERRTSACDSPYEAGKEIRQWHESKPEPCDRRYRARIALGNGNRVPDNDQPEKGAACVAHECSGVPVALHGQIEEQEADNCRTGNRGDRHGRGRPTAGCCTCKQCDEGHGSRQSIDAVDEIEGIDDRYRYQYGYQDANRSRLNDPESERIPDIGDDESAADDHDQCRGYLRKKPRDAGQAPPVIQYTDHDQERAGR